MVLVNALKRALRSCGRLRSSLVWCCCFLFVGGNQPPAPSPPTLPSIHARMLTPHEYRDSLVTREAWRQHMSARRMLAVARVENPWAKPDTVSWAGAIGLMQVMSVHAGNFPECRTRTGLGQWLDIHDLYDPVTNVCYGVSIYKMYLRHCRGNTYCALARYNGAVTLAKAELYNAQVQNAMEGL